MSQSLSLASLCVMISYPCSALHQTHRSILLHAKRFRRVDPFNHESKRQLSQRLTALRKYENGHFPELGFWDERSSAFFAFVRVPCDQKDALVQVLLVRSCLQPALKRLKAGHARETCLLYYHCSSRGLVTQCTGRLPDPEAIAREPGHFEGSDRHLSGVGSVTRRRTP